MKVNVNLLNKTNQRVAVLEEKPVRISEKGYAGVVHKGKVFPLYQGNIIFAHDTTYTKKEYFNFASSAADFTYHKTDEWIPDYDSKDKKTIKPKVIKASSKNNSKSKSKNTAQNILEVVEVLHSNLWPEPAFISSNEKPKYSSGSNEPNVALHDQDDPKFFNSNSKSPTQYLSDEFDYDEEEFLTEPDESNCEDYTALKFDRGDKKIEIGVFELLRNGWLYANPSRYEDERLIINGKNTRFVILQLIQAFGEPEVTTIFIDMRKSYPEIVQYDNAHDAIYCEEVYQDAKQQILVKTRSHGILRINSNYEFEQVV